MAMAQMNWGRMKNFLKDKRMLEFSNSLNKVYDLAEKHYGFIWCISYKEIKSQLINLGFDEFISATVSVWDNLDLLKNFIYNSLHGIYLKRSYEWFEKIDGPSFVIWSVKNHEKPSFKESFDRLEYLKINSSSDYTYDWEKKF
jgi:hypothetical protein